jgi:hypothetical protein
LSIFRTDFYAKIKVANFNLTSSSEMLLKSLKESSALQNVQMTRVRKDVEEQGKITIEEWYEVSGSINVPEGGKSFWVLSKEITEKEPFNFFMRVDRNIKADDQDSARANALIWLKQALIKPLENGLILEEMTISSPENISEIANKLRDSK